jgi:heme oxygenase
MEQYSILRHRPPGSAREFLKQGLATLHETLDARVSAACLRPVRSLPRLLRLHAEALPPLVAGLDRAGAARLCPGWDEPERLAALSEDLRAHGLPSGTGESPARFASEAAAWGGLYALLGSRLGTLVVLRQFTAAGQPADSAFLHHGGGGWPAFLARLEAALAGPGLAEALGGAELVMRRYLTAATRLLWPAGQDEGHALVRA